MADTDANSLWDLGLEVLTDADSDLDLTGLRGIPDPPAPTPQTPPRLHRSTLRASQPAWITLYQSWLASEKLTLPEKFHDELGISSWRCSFIQWNGVSCGTFNGFDTKRRIRKTCSRCKQPRKDTKTVLDLTLEPISDSLAESKKSTLILREKARD